MKVLSAEYGDELDVCVASRHALGQSIGAATKPTKLLPIGVGNAATFCSMLSPYHVSTLCCTVLTSKPTSLMALS